MAREEPSSGPLTVQALVEDYLSRGPATRIVKRASSWRTDASGLRRHVIPLLGARPVASLRRDDVSQMCFDIINGRTAVVERTRKKGVARVRGGPGAAAVTLRSFKAMLNWALERDLISNNPAVGVRLPPRPRRGRFLSREEARHLLATIKDCEHRGTLNPAHADAIRLLLLTGARRTEIMGLRWAEVELGRGRLLLPPERSKTGVLTGERVIALSPDAAEILRRQPRSGQYVFPAANGQSGHFTGIQKSWVMVRSRAGLDNMRIHDLRHTFASFALEAGENIIAISAALGHSSTLMTERYLHLRSHATSSVAARTAKFILG